MSLGGVGMRVFPQMLVFDEYLLDACDLLYALLWTTANNISLTTPQQMPWNSDQNNRYTSWIEI